jgi:hypothetical protein
MSRTKRDRRSSNIGSSQSISYTGRSWTRTSLNHLLPFADEFGKRVLARQRVILAGEGHATGLAAGSQGDALYHTLAVRPRAEVIRRFWRPRRN